MNRDSSVENQKDEIGVAVCCKQPVDGKKDYFHGNIINILGLNDE